MALQTEVDAFRTAPSQLLFDVVLGHAIELTAMELSSPMKQSISGPSKSGSFAVDLPDHGRVARLVSLFPDKHTDPAVVLSEQRKLINDLKERMT